MELMINFTAMADLISVVNRPCSDIALLQGYIIKVIKYSTELTVEQIGSLRLESSQIKLN